MGLDCTAYPKVTLLRECTASDLTDGDWSDMDDAGSVFLANPDFPERSDGLPTGVYAVEGERFHWHAGSYSGYNAWRAALCQVALGVPPQTVWDDIEQWADKPFVPLINFSDCEGFLGPQVCARLHADFEARPDLGEKIAAQTGDPWGTTGLANAWRQALALTAGHGVIRFH